MMERELRGDYKGGTVQVIPHVTNEIKDHIREAAEAAGAEVAIVEIGGTVGDLEGAPIWKPSARCAGRKARTTPALFM